MTGTGTNFSTSLNTLTATYRSAVSNALTGAVASLRSQESADLVNATLGVLAAQCLEIDQAGTVTKTDEVEVASQVEGIKDVLDNVAVLESNKAGSKGPLVAAQQALQGAGENLGVGLDQLVKEIAAAVVSGYSNSDAATNGAKAMLQRSVKHYDAMVADVLAQAQVPFRTAAATAALQAAINALSETLGTADAKPLTIKEGQDLALVARQQLVRVQGAFAPLQKADSDYIRSTKVATLDQSKLNPYAEILIDVDAAFSRELDFMFGDTAVDPGEATELNDAVNAAAAMNVPNMPAPDDIA